MFSSTTFESVGFDSISDDLKTKANVSQQTSEFTVVDKGEQSNELLNKDVQSESQNEIRKAKYDEHKLLNFLNKVTGPLLKELDKVERSKAFTVQRITGEDEFSGQTKELYVLDGPTIPEMTHAKVSCLSWSCTGNVIAVGYESISHEGWCTHESLVNFYNISSYRFDGKSVTHSIKTDSCVTSLAMHPHEPAVVALATYSGNVEVWSVGKDGRSDGVCLSKEQYHEDMITQIGWANDTSQQLILVTSSLDNRMCILKSVSIGDTQLIDKYVLHPESPDILKPGITCFSFCKNQPGTFVAGFESGQLMLCSTFSVTKSQSDGVEKSPVLRQLDKRHGPITFIQFSPHDDHVFLVATLDFSFSLHSIQQDAPLLEIYSDFDIIGADWLPTQSKTLIAWGTSSKLYVYNEDGGQKIGELAPDEISRYKNRRYHKVLFNTKSAKLMAIAGTDAKSYIWTIPTTIRRQMQ